MKQAKLTSYLIFLFFLAIWTGAGFFTTITSNYAWYVDPLGYAKFTSASEFPGVLPTWPLLTAFLILACLNTLILFWRYKGPGKKRIHTILGLTAFILLVTMAWFVPTLNKLFAPGSTLNDTEIVSLSKTWIILNVIRQIMLGWLLWSGLKSLLEISMPKSQIS